MNKVCCGFGHRDLNIDVGAQLEMIIEKLILENDVDIFMTGGMGEFDRLFIEHVVRAKIRYPHIKLLLVLPYLTQRINNEKYYYESIFDEVIIPDETAELHYKKAITKRNQWLAKNSDYVVGYVVRNYGGAYSALKYAEKLNKMVFDIVGK